MSEDIVIVDAGRTAIGNFGGSLSSLPAPTLGAEVIKVLLERTGLKKDLVDEVIMGQVLTAGSGQNPARQTSISAGLPYEVSSMTINMVCGSGLKAIHLAMQAIASGDADIVIAGGQENMSMAPHVLPNSRNGSTMGDWKLVDTMVNDGLWDVYNNYHMGKTAENVAEKYCLNRKVQDEFAAQSQQRFEKAQQDNRFVDEIIPISIPQRKGDAIIFKKDEYPRAGTTAESLSKLRPAFEKEGTVTAGNASGINDGAAALILMKKSKAEELGLKSMGRVVSFASAGVDPAYMGAAPIPASKSAWKKRVGVLMI